MKKKTSFHVAILALLCCLSMLLCSSCSKGSSLANSPAEDTNQFVMLTDY